MARRVIAYEDDPALRNQLESIFSALRGDYELLAAFPNAKGVEAEIHHYKPDAVLMDIQMQDDDDGLEALYRIKQTSPGVRVLMLTMFDSDHKVFNAICLGADGYMLKSDFSSKQLNHEVMRHSLQNMFNEGAYLTPSVAGKILKLFSDKTLVARIKVVTDRFHSILQRESKGDTYKESGLTKTQTIVLQKIVDGMTTAQMAREMGVTENTINSHIKAIYTTLGVHSRALAIKKAMELRGMR